MIALLHAELLKLRTTRTFAGLVGAALVLSLLIVILFGLLEDSPDPREMLTVDASGFFVLLLGAIGITGEWRHRTITSSLLAAPNRVRFLVAKVLAYAAAGTVLSVVVTLAVAVASSIILAAQGDDLASFGDVVDVLWRNALVAALLGALGVAIGSVIRHQMGALIAILVLSFVLEPTVLGLEPDAGKFLPLSGAPSGILEAGDFGDTSPDELLAPGVAVLVELAWIGALAALGGLLLRRRDL